MDQLEIIWHKTLEIFKDQLSDKIIFDSFFAPLTIKEIIDDDIIITIETKWNYDEIILHKDELQEIFNTISNSYYHLVFMLEEEYLKNHHVTNDFFDYEDNLNSELTFETFVVGNSNRIAQNASLAVAMKPGI